MEYKTPKYAERNYEISRAIKEFGIENFKFEVIEECNKNLLHEREKYWISKLAPEYNKNNGGLGNLGYKPSDKTKALLSEYGKTQWVNKTEAEREFIKTNNLKGRPVGYKHLESTKQKLREINLGKKMSEETKRKISVANKGKNDNRSHFKKVAGFNEFCFYLFDSVKEAGEFFGVKPYRISVALKGKRRHFRNLSWIYWSVETIGDECNQVGTILSRAEVQGILDLKDEEIVHTTKMGNLLSYDKGFVQLAMRSGQYKTINCREVYEGEIVSENKFTGDYEFGQATSDKVVGYMAYFKLLNGFEKYLYMSREELEKHGKKYSQTYKRGSGLWSTDFESMARKTCLKQLLSKYGILSIEMQRAQTFDQAVVKNDLINENVDEADIEYVDNNPEEARRQAMKEAMQEAEVVDTETGELFK
jgi:recombination protein RecT